MSFSQNWILQGTRYCWPRLVEVLQINIKDHHFFEGTARLRPKNRKVYPLFLRHTWVQHLCDLYVWGGGGGGWGGVLGWQKILATTLSSVAACDTCFFWAWQSQLCMYACVCLHLCVSVAFGRAEALMYIYAVRQLIGKSTEHHSCLWIAWMLTIPSPVLCCGWFWRRSLCHLGCCHH